MGPAPEGSDERKLARFVLYELAHRAHQQGASFDRWLEVESSSASGQARIDAVAQRDLEAIFNLVWRKRRR